jgi:hypothetical protein
MMQRMKKLIDKDFIRLKLKTVTRDEAFEQLYILKAIDAESKRIYYSIYFIKK